MPRRTPAVLHRNDPSRAPLVGHVKVTREDWINVARDALVADGVGGVKIQLLAAQMSVSRSSFYWYFKNRDDLLQALLEDWEARNTQPILAHCQMPSGSICAACCNFFKCFVNPALFDKDLDFAIREWARRTPSIRARIDAADAVRLEAVTDMFRRHDYASADADARARILYYMQLGYHALEVRESMPLRMSRIEPYLLGFTGRPPQDEVISAFSRYALEIAKSR